MIKFVHGNIFDAQVDALVNQVNCIGVMGAGLALKFKQKFPDYFKDYKYECDCERMYPGYVHVYSNIVSPRFIISFPTKTNWKNPSKLEWVESGLESLKKAIKENGIKSIAIPALGCGNGGLDWKRVKQLIIEKMLPLTKVEVLVYEP